MSNALKDNSTTAPRSHLFRGLRITLTCLGAIAVLAVYLLLAMHYIERGEMNADEGFYAASARLAMQGQVAHRDFAYTQMPLLPYINGVFLREIGYTLNNQRALNAAWAGLGLLALVLALRWRLGHWEPGLLAAFVVGVSPHWVALQALGKTHAASGCFLSVATAVLLVRGPFLTRAICFSAVAALAVGCRLSCAPVVAILAVALLLQAHGWRDRVLALALPTAMALLIIGPFFLAAPANFFFFVWEYHTQSTFMRRSLAQAVEWWQIAPGAIIILLTGLSGAVQLVSKRMWVELTFLSAALAGLVLPMLPVSAYGTYITPVLPAAAALGVAAIWGAGFGRENPFRHVLWILPALALFQPLPDTVPPMNRADRHVSACAEYLRTRVEPGPVLTPLPIIATTAGRSLLPGTTMGMFSAMAPQHLVRARQLHLTTLPELTRLVEAKQPAAIVLLRGTAVWNFRWRVPTLRRQPPRAFQGFLLAIEQHYKQEYSSGNIVIHTRRDAQE